MSCYICITVRVPELKVVRVTSSEVVRVTHL